MSKLSIAMIVRDDESTLEACLQSIRPHVDEIVICDTGSTDASPEIAKRYADKWERFTDCNDANGLIADFAMARQHSFDMATHDWCGWLDADDLLIGGEHLRALTATTPTSPTFYLVDYDYSHDAEGRVTCVHRRENLCYPREAFSWQVPVHEVLMPKPGLSVTPLETNAIRRVHRKQLSTKNHEPGRNLRILRQYVAKNGEGDVRAMYYYGVELAGAREFGPALRVLRRYVQLAGWTDEKCLALLEIARIYGGLGDMDSCLEWATKAMITKGWAEPYWMLTELFFSLAQQGVEPAYNYRRSAHFAQLGLSLPPTDTMLFTNPTSRSTVHQFLNVALAQLGDIEGALASCLKGLEGMPESAELAHNARLYEGQLAKGRIVAEVTKLTQRGMVDQPFVDALQQAITPPAPPAPPLVQAPLVEPQPVSENGLDIILFTGPAFEQWTPETLKATGMGGSETMAWELMRRLRERGHRVRHYGCCSVAQEGVYEGVEWLDATRYRNLDCDVLITSRQPAAVDDDFNVTADARFLWVHDVHVGDALTQKRDLRIDRILALSRWHRDFLKACYPMMDPDKIIVTRNGIDPTRFQLPEGEKRNPKRVVYSSSPDRGLHTLLQIWPRILAEEPEAELHIYYGFENFDATAKQRNDQQMMQLSAWLKQAIASTPRVTMHGRVNGAELAREMCRSGVWAYPTWFSETSCISAMEAQAAGLFCITTPVAALAETAAHAMGTLVPGITEELTDQQPEEFLAAFTSAMVGVIRDETPGGGGVPEKHLSRQAEFAHERFSLDALADDWDRMLREVLADVALHVVPRFHQFKVAA